MNINKHLLPLALTIISCMPIQAMQKPFLKAPDYFAQLPNEIIMHIASYVASDHPKKACNDLAALGVTCIKLADLMQDQKINYALQSQTSEQIDLLQSMFNLACKHGDTEAIKYFIKTYGINPNENNVLILAIKMGNMSLINFLLAQPHIDINRIPENEIWTPLMHAVALRKQIIVKRLLADHRLKINHKKYNDAITPSYGCRSMHVLEIAQMLSTDEIISLLKKHGAVNNVKYFTDLTINLQL